MVQLPIRGAPYIVPPYSLTGDLLAFRKCGLQYRYLNGSALPPARPVQLWFGEFIHGVLELALRGYKQGVRTTFPWNGADLDELSDVVSARLRSAGKVPRSRVAEAVARERATIAVNRLGPLLFPLVVNAEVALSGTREMPVASRFRADYYEVTGRIDVLTNLSLRAAPAGTNPIVDLVRDRIPTAEIVNESEVFEVIVDYKGTRRPPTNSADWQLYEWQLQTYAWLRERQPGSRPVRAALLVFVNELLPSRTDMGKLRDDIANGTTDVRPANDSPDLPIVLRSPAPASRSPFGLSWEFRLARALRLISVDDADQANALLQFDGVVQEIEGAVQSELATGSITATWGANPNPQVCVACDFRTMCAESPYRGPPQTPLGSGQSDPEIDDI